MGKLKEVKFSVYHHDCHGSISTEKFPGITLTQLSPVVQLSKPGTEVTYQILWGIEAGSKSELDEYLKFLKGMKHTKKIEIVQRTDSSAMIFYMTRAKSSMYDKIVHSRGILINPVTTEKGLENLSVLTPTSKDMESLMKEVGDVGQFKVASIRDYKPENPEVTKKQKETIAAALRMGYYEWPRKVTLDEMAKAIGIKRRALQERLRRAERKLLPQLLKKYVGDE